MRSRKYVAWLIAGSLVGTCVLAGAANAPKTLAVVVREYEIPRERAFPHDPTVGPDGIVWYTDQSNSYIGRLDPETGKITDYPTPTPRSGPHGITVARDGGVWYTGNANGRLGRLDPKTGTITEYPLPESAGDPHTLIEYQGKIWFTVQRANSYGWLDPRTGATRVFRVASKGAKPYGIVSAPSGLFIALFGTNRLGHIVPETGQMHEIVLPDSASRPRRLAVGSDGVIWYTDYARHKLGAITKSGHREWQTPTPNGSPYGIAIDPKGVVWYNEARSSLIVSFDPRTERMDTVRIPTSGAIVRHMQTDSARSRLWLALSGTGRIGRIDLPR